MNRITSGPEPTIAFFPVAEVQILAVVVLYKMALRDSPTLRTLLSAARTADSSRLRLQIRVVDNTPGAQDPGDLPPGVTYVSSLDNPGLSRPYNDAWQVAARDGYRWLLTLDQDTHLPDSFLSSLAEVVRQYDANESVAAIVPRVVDHGRAISPVRFLGGFLPRVEAPDAGPLLGRHALAVNSASLLRVSALKDVNGYDEAFPLHNSDTALFQRLDRAGKRVVLATNIVVNHELAIMDREGRMSGDRYRSMLVDERMFWDLHMGLLGRAERMLRLVGRVAKDLIRNRPGHFAAVTAQEVWLRLRTRRKDRVAAFTLGRSELSSR